jgi:hypothetical protein
MRRRREACKGYSLGAHNYESDNNQPTWAKAQVDALRLYSHSCFNRIAGLSNRHLKLQLGLRLRQRFPVVVENLGMDKLRTTAQETTDVKGGGGGGGEALLWLEGFLGFEPRMVMFILWMHHPRCVLCKLGGVRYVKTQLSLYQFY